jgi:circadian clock protein KaiB
MATSKKAAAPRRRVKTPQARGLEAAPLRGGPDAEVDPRLCQSQSALRRAPEKPLPDRGHRYPGPPGHGARRSDRRHPDAGHQAAAAGAEIIGDLSDTDKVLVGWPCSRSYEEASARRQYVLRLYVSRSTLRSKIAIENIERVCEEHLHGRYDLEVIDIHRHAQLARDEQIVAVPTLIKRLPAPLQRLVGDMSDLSKVLFGLDLKVRET